MPGATVDDVLARAVDRTSVGVVSGGVCGVLSGSRAGGVCGAVYAGSPAIAAGGGRCAMRDR